MLPSDFLVTLVLEWDNSLREMVADSGDGEIFAFEISVSASGRLPARFRGLPEVHTSATLPLVPLHFLVLGFRGLSMELPLSVKECPVVAEFVDKPSEGFGLDIGLVDWYGPSLERLSPIESSLVLELFELLTLFADAAATD